MYIIISYLLCHLTPRAFVHGDAKTQRPTATKAACRELYNISLVFVKLDASVDQLEVPACLACGSDLHCDRAVFVICDASITRRLSKVPLREFFCD